ncbi:hypothetical protein HAX54_044672 [Datura stramonium]|uniref:Uncharacterized protein n=1 Tax=Datura stramonium TaxID=4076 RepID=A0ABS8SPG5_DATST|nr:hypothetical protein [Datura stramonium]
MSRGTLLRSSSLHAVSYTMHRIPTLAGKYWVNRVKNNGLSLGKMGENFGSLRAFLWNSHFGILSSGVASVIADQTGSSLLWHPLTLPETQFCLQDRQLIAFADLPSDSPLFTALRGNLVQSTRSMLAGASKLSSAVLRLIRIFYPEVIA